MKYCIENRNFSAKNRTYEAMTFTPVKTLNRTIGCGTLAVFAGPCVAESRDLCLRVAEHMAAVCEKLGVIIDGCRKRK